MAPSHWLTAIGVFLVLFGLGVFALAIREAMKSNRARLWPSTLGTVIACDVEIYSRSDDRAYRLNVRYRYEVAGRAYTGFRIRLFDGSGLLWWMRRKAQKYPEGSKVRVYYSPSNPQDAMLVPGLDATRFASLLVAGVVVLLNGINLLTRY